MDKDRLYLARNARRLSQGQLAEKAKVSRQFLRRLEHGEANPSVGLLVRLADVLEVSTDYLLGRTDDYLLGRPTNPKPEVAE